MVNGIYSQKLLLHSLCNLFSKKNAFTMEFKFKNAYYTLILVNLQEIGIYVMNFMYNVRALYIKFVVLYFMSNIIFQIFYNPLHKPKYTVNRSGVFIAEQPGQLPHQF